MGEGAEREHRPSMIAWIVVVAVFMAPLFIGGVLIEHQARVGHPPVLMPLVWIWSFPTFIFLIMPLFARKSKRRFVRGLILVFVGLFYFGAVFIFSLNIFAIPYPFHADGSYVNTHLVNARLTGNLQRANFSSSDLTDCLAFKANLTHTDFAYARLEGANLSRADFTGANLTYANLEGTDLSGADFTETRLDGVSLSNANLTGVIGISDDILALALGVSIDRLPFVLTQEGIRLESRESIFQGLKDVCLRQGVEEAGTYTADERFHPAILLSVQGEPHRWSIHAFKVPAEKLEPMALRFCELVGIAEEEEAVVIEVRKYVWEFSGLPAPPITRYQYQMTVRLYAAKTGEVVAENTFQGSMPGPCPDRASASKTEIYGGHVSEADVLDWLSGFVNQSGF